MILLSIFNLNYQSVIDMFPLSTTGSTPQVRHFLQLQQINSSD